MLKLSSNKNGFEDVFFEIKANDKLNILNPSKLKFYYLRPQNNKFDYKMLVKHIKKNIGRYVFSRETIKKYIDEDEMEVIALDATEKLRSVKNEKDSGAGGELGEILLYIFLEQELGAPKIISKIELKTTANQYVHGSDGVHLLVDKVEDKICYKLIYGEAKLKGDLKEAIKEAFISLKTSVNDEFEIDLISTHILKESFDEETIKRIKNILIPTENTEEICENAYGIFLGFSLNINRDIPTIKYKELLEKELKEKIEEIIPYISKKIVEDEKLKYSSFYIYILPFDNVKEDRVEIIRRIKVGD